MKINIDVRGPNMGKKLGDAWPRVQEAGAQALAEEWHSEFLPKHFTSGGASVYDYQLRVLGYRHSTDEGAQQYVGWQRTRYKQGRGIVIEVVQMPDSDYTAKTTRKGAKGAPDKERRAKYWLLGVPYRPLRKSGLMEAQARSGFHLSRRNSKSLKLVVNLPKHAYQYRKDTWRKPPINKVEELYRIADSEQPALGRAFAAGLEAALARLAKTAV